MSTHDAEHADVSLPPMRKWPKPADVLVVLGAKLRPDGTPGPALARRVAMAAALWRAGAAPVVMVSGGAPAGGLSEAAAMTRLLTGRHRLPPDAVVCEGASLDTLGNARESLALAAARGWRRLIVVTDGLHLRRALWTFRTLARPLGIAVEGAAAPGPARWSGAWWALGAREAAALAAYAWRLPRAGR